MVCKALEAAEDLAKEGLSVRVVNVSTIKPLDRDAVVAQADGMQAIVTAEEHNVFGGLGSAVVEALRGVRHAPVEFIGVQDSFGLSAENYEILLRHFGLTAAALADAVKRLLGKA
jgi:transketolase